MCTAFIKRGDDLLFGYNLDIDPAVWNYSIIKKKSIFTVGIRLGSTLYYTHGVNEEGHFANLPYMNGADVGHRGVGRGQYRIDLLVDRYLRGKLSYRQVSEIAGSKTLVSGAGASVHALVGDGEGHILLLEPSYGVREIRETCACVTNFPLIPALPDYSNPFYGKERYDRACSILRSADDSFSALDGMELLKTVKQEGQWGTRLSFVYSRRENAVYFCTDGEFGHMEKWQLGEPSAKNNRVEPVGEGDTLC